GGDDDDERCSCHGDEPAPAGCGPADHAPHGRSRGGRGAAVRHRRPLAADSTHGRGPAVGAVGGRLRAQRGARGARPVAARAHTFSVGDLVLAAGLFLTSPTDLVLAQVVGTAATLVIYRR